MLTDQAVKLLTELAQRERELEDPKHPLKAVISKQLQRKDDAAVRRVLLLLGGPPVLNADVVIGMLTGVLVARGLAEMMEEASLVHQAAGLDHFVTVFGSQVERMAKEGVL